MLTMSPGPTESHGFEYQRNGTLSLLAALNTASGEVQGKTAPHCTSKQFVAFLPDIVASLPEEQGIQAICDNGRRHRTNRVKDLLAAIRNVQIYFGPTRSAWLHQVKNWSSRIQRDVIDCGTFTSAKYLGRRLVQLDRDHNNDSKPMNWSTTVHQYEVGRCQFNG